MSKLHTWWVTGRARVRIVGKTLRVRIVRMGGRRGQGRRKVFVVGRVAGGLRVDLGDGGEIVGRWRQIDAHMAVEGGRRFLAALGYIGYPRVTTAAVGTSWI